MTITQGWVRLMNESSHVSWCRAGTHSPLPLSNTMFLKVEHTTWTAPVQFQDFLGFVQSCPGVYTSFHGPNILGIL